MQHHQDMHVKLELCCAHSVSSGNATVQGVGAPGGRGGPGTQVALSPDSVERSHIPATTVPRAGTLVSPAQTRTMWPKTRKTGHREGRGDVCLWAPTSTSSHPCFIWIYPYSHGNVQCTAVCQQSSWLSREERLHTQVTSYVHPER